MALKSLITANSTRNIRAILNTPVTQYSSWFENGRFAQNYRFLIKATFSNPIELRKTEAVVEIIELVIEKDSRCSVNNQVTLKESQ